MNKPLGENHWSNCMVKVDEEIYIALNSTNAFLKSNLEFSKFEYLGRFPIAGINENNIFMAVINYKFKLYFFSKTRPYIVLVDMKKNIYDIIEIPMPAEKKNYFGALGYIPFVSDDELYFLERKYRTLYKLNSETMETEIIGGIDESESILAPYNVANDQIEIFSSFTENAIYIFESENKSGLKKIYIGDKNYRFWDVILVNDEIWINVINEPIILNYSVKHNKLKKIKISFGKNIDNCKGKFIETDDDIYFFPEEINEFIAINRNTGDIRYFTDERVFRKRIYLYHTLKNVLFRYVNLNIADTVNFNLENFKGENVEFQHCIESDVWLGLSKKISEKLFCENKKIVYKENDIIRGDCFFQYITQINSNNTGGFIEECGKNIYEFLKNSREKF